MPGWELILEFDTDDPAFAHGVEVGQLYERLKHEALPVYALVHARNAEMVIRLAEQASLTVTAVDITADVLAVTFTREG